MGERFSVAGNRIGAWQVLDEGEEVATVSGPMSACIALAAVEHLNSFGDRVNDGFFVNWTGRLWKFLERNKS